MIEDVRVVKVFDGLVHIFSILILQHIVDVVHDEVDGLIVILDISKLLDEGYKERIAIETLNEFLCFIQGCNGSYPIAIIGSIGLYGEPPSCI